MDNLAPTREELVAYLRERRNWGRWGPDDQHGAMNLITPEGRVAASALVRSGRAVSLCRPLPTAPAPNNRRPAMLYMERVPHPDGGGASKDFQGMAYHGQSATHIDALCHAWDADGMWGGREPDEEIRIDGSRWGSVDQWRDGIYTRGVLLDIPRFRGVPYVDHGRSVHGHELEAICQAQGVTLQPGDAVAVHCGRAAYEQELGPWSADMTNRAGLDASCLPFFREHDVSVVLWDMWDVAPDPYGLAFGVHSVLFAFGVGVIDAALLEPLARACQEEGRYEFLLTVNPLDVRGATGSLVNPVAMF